MHFAVTAGFVLVDECWETSKTTPDVLAEVEPSMVSYNPTSENNVSMIGLGKH